MKPEADIKTFVAQTSQEKVGILEGIVTSRSSLNGHTMGEIQLKQLFTLNPLAMMRGAEIHIAKLDSMVLKPGDAVLLAGGWDNLKYLQEKTDIVYTEKLRGVEVKEEKVWVALAALASFLVLSIFMNLSLAVSGLVALMVLVIGKALHIDEVYRPIEWKTVLQVDLGYH